MNNLKELVNKVYKDLQESDWVKQYPELRQKGVVSNELQDIALDIMPDYVEKSKLKEFVSVTEENYNEDTFKKFVINYTEFLDKVEEEFYKCLLLGLTE